MVYRNVGYIEARFGDDIKVRKDMWDLARIMMDSTNYDRPVPVMRETKV